MDKYLFTDGTNGVKAAYSKEELLALINSAPEPARARIWIYSSNEWISLPAFQAQQPAFAGKDPIRPAKIAEEAPPEPVRRKTWLRAPLVFIAAITGALLIFNFTSAKWEKAGTITATAARPANVPWLDLDSLVSEIEYLRGKPLDKSTRINFRLRNNWPEHILLQLEAAKETKGDHNRFYHVTVSIDNASGFVLDKAAVKLETWKNGKVSIADTLQFSNIRYDKLLLRELNSTFRCDSMSVSFLSLQAKAFNFCYSAGTKNNSGNVHDRWFCVKGNPSTP